MLNYTFTHFQKIADENRFPENASIEHDSDKCLVCHPEKISGDPFKFCLDLVISCILRRRPKLDDSLIEAINEELEMLGEDIRISREALLNEQPEALRAWRIWAWESINTALEMLSMHSDRAPYFHLDDVDDSKKKEYIGKKLDEFFKAQKNR